MRLGKIFGIAALGIALAFGGAGIAAAADVVSSRAGFPPAPAPYKGKLRHKAIHHKVIRHKETNHWRAAKHEIHAGHKIRGEYHAHKAVRHEITRRERYHQRPESRQVCAQRKHYRRIESHELHAPQTVARYAGQSGLAGEWQIVSVNGKSAITGMRGALPGIKFSGNRLSGQSGCNDFSGTIMGSAAQMQFAPVSATQISCPKPLLKQEREVYQALAAARSYRFVSRLYDQFAGQKIVGGVRIVRELQLLDDKGQVALILVGRQ